MIDNIYIFLKKNVNCSLLWKIILREIFGEEFWLIFDFVVSLYMILEDILFYCFGVGFVDVLLMV